MMIGFSEGESNKSTMREPLARWGLSHNQTSGACLSRSGSSDRPAVDV